MGVKHFLIDWETLDTVPEAVVLSCNVMQFDPAAEGDTVVRATTVNFIHTVAEQIKLGRTVSSGTLKFWLQQEEAARAAVTEGGYMAPTVESGLKNIGGFVLGAFEKGDDPATEYRIWGNGADFDVAILNSLRRHLFLDKLIPFTHRGHRCARTVAAAFPDLRVKPSGSEVHIPYYDNAAMARTLRNIYARVPELFN